MRLNSFSIILSTFSIFHLDQQTQITIIIVLIIKYLETKIIMHKNKKVSIFFRLKKVASWTCPTTAATSPTPTNQLQAFIPSSKPSSFSPTSCPGPPYWPPWSSTYWCGLCSSSTSTGPRKIGTPPRRFRTCRCPQGATGCQ